LRDGYIRDKYKSKEFIESHTNEQNENAIRYGHPYIGELYRPHLTLTLLRNELDQDEVLKMIKWNDNFIKVDEVMLCRMGDWGTCRETVSSRKI